MSDMQRNLDAFRLDRLRSESIRQNCSNQLIASKMKLIQLQEEFQHMTAKLKVGFKPYSPVECLEFEFHTEYLLLKS